MDEEDCGCGINLMLTIEYLVRRCSLLTKFRIMLFTEFVSPRDELSEILKGTTLHV